MEAEPATDLAGLAAQFEDLARQTAGGLYGRICQGVAADPELLELAAEAGGRQRRPNILLAAVHYLLLGGADHPLAGYYPTVVDRADPGDPGPAFRSFCLGHRDELAALIASRATQTNEVGRCAALLPALACVHLRTGGPLGVLEVGASAGLNLLFDRYSYDYGDGRVRGATTSPVRVASRLGQGSLDWLPEAPPPVVWRAGLDADPVDVTDDDAVRWLLACMWPGETERIERLQRAVELARSAPPPVARGDAVDDLAGAAAAAPAEAALCVVHTWTLAYLDSARQAEFAAAVDRLAARRPVHWVFAEQPSEVPGLVVPGRESHDSRYTAVVLADRPGRSAVRLADMHPHGRWLRWYGVGDRGGAPLTPA